MSNQTFEPITRPEPEITPLTAPFWDAAANGKLSTPICRSCGKRHMPPGPMCPHCLSADLTWEPVSGRGTLKSWVVFHQVYWDSVRDQIPYLSCTVDLDEGVRLITNLVGTAAENPRYLMPVKVTFRPLASGQMLPVFQAAD